MTEDGVQDLEQMYDTLILMTDKAVKALNPLRKQNIDITKQSGFVFHTFEVTRGKVGEALLKMSNKG